MSRGFFRRAGEIFFRPQRMVFVDGEPEAEAMSGADLLNEFPRGEEIDWKTGLRQYRVRLSDPGQASGVAEETDGLLSSMGRPELLERIAALPEFMDLFPERLLPIFNRLAGHQKINLANRLGIEVLTRMARNKAAEAGGGIPHLIKRTRRRLTKEVRQEMKGFEELVLSHDRPAIKAAVEELLVKPGGMDTLEQFVERQAHDMKKMWGARGLWGPAYETLTRLLGDTRFVKACPGAAYYAAEALWIDHAEKEQVLEVLRTGLGAWEEKKAEEEVSIDDRAWVQFSSEDATIIRGLCDKARRRPHTSMAKRDDETAYAKATLGDIASFLGMQFDESGSLDGLRCRLYLGSDDSLAKGRVWEQLLAGAFYKRMGELLPADIQVRQDQAKEEESG